MVNTGAIAVTTNPFQLQTCIVTCYQQRITCQHSVSFLPLVNIFVLPIMQLRANNQGNSIAKILASNFEKFLFYVTSRRILLKTAEKNTMFQVQRPSSISNRLYFWSLRTLDYNIGWPSQPSRTLIRHFRHFPWDARTGIAVGRRLRTALDLVANGGEATFLFREFFELDHYSGWWFQPIWKILVKLAIFPK